ncbi:hypothetical protein PRZ48_002647 [Zasmidium cellare]|uniref:Uncharacterized protein n=1 Tax=Zasmidium cellare TaxID=395010 RepID=A0ABR0EU19_ZASCE|nr:hypothetical protein PRZ48_002647 [Zasmidium cellare]
MVGGNKFIPLVQDSVPRPRQSLSDEIRRVSSLVDDQVNEGRKEVSNLPGQICAQSDGASKGKLTDKLQRQAANFIVTTGPLVQSLEDVDSEDRRFMELQQKYRDLEQQLRSRELELENERVREQVESAEHPDNIGPSKDDEQRRPLATPSCTRCSARNTPPREPRIRMPGFTLLYEDPDADPEESLDEPIEWDMGAELRKLYEQWGPAKKQCSFVLRAFGKRAWILSTIADLPQRPGHADKESEESIVPQQDERSGEGASSAGEQTAKQGVEADATEIPHDAQQSESRRTLCDKSPSLSSPQETSASSAPTPSEQPRQQEEMDGDWNVIEK